jgi:hypothetical protein
MSLSLFRSNEPNWSRNKSYDSPLTFGRKILKSYQDDNQEYCRNSSIKRKIIIYNKIEIKDEVGNKLYCSNIKSGDLIVIKANI